jgi:lysophospholipase L1-like esterase
MNRFLVKIPGKKPKFQRVILFWILIALTILVLAVIKIYHFSAVKSAPGASRVKTGSSLSAVSSSAPASSATAPHEATKSDYKYFDDAVFVGDSITDGFANYDYFSSDLLVTSIGASTYTAVTDHQMPINESKSDVGWMPDRIAAKDPKKIYLLLGSNDLGWMSVSQYIDYYGQFIDLLEQKCPGVKIYVQSITPMCASVENSKDWPMDNEKIENYNAALKPMCITKGIKYLDIASVLKGPDGKLPADSSDDGVHLRTKEYKLWIDYLVSNE